jgi:hypothetical protein
MYLYARPVEGTDYEPLKSLTTTEVGHWHAVPYPEGLIVAYWRKANAVHAWFVDHVQGGEDDCNTYPVSIDALRELRTACQRAAKHYDAGELPAAAEVLPPAAGFFFGSTEVDTWYRADLESTINQLDHILSVEVPARFHYQASW